MHRNISDAGQRMQSSVHLVGEAHKLGDARVCMPRTHMGIDVI